MSNRNAVFLDSNGWIALLEADDRLHAGAAGLLHELVAARRLFITTDWIVAETGNGLAGVKGRGRFARAVDSFRSSPNGKLVWMNEELFQAALDLYDRATDKSWGLVDCASFVVMRREHILDAFTTDHHFEQAGFRRLLTPELR